MRWAKGLELGRQAALLNRVAGVGCFEKGYLSKDVK